MLILPVAHVLTYLDLTSFPTEMRRARISIKPNVRPGGRAVAPTTESKTLQESAAVDSTQQTHTGEQLETPSPSPRSHLEVIEPAVAAGDGNVPGCPSEKASVNT